MSDSSDGFDAFPPSSTPPSSSTSSSPSSFESSAAPATPPPPFPPPTAPAGNPSRVPWIVAAVAGVVALLFAVLWIVANGAAGDAEAERDEARSLLSANVDEQRSNADALIETQAELTASQEEVSRLRSELEAAQTAVVEVEPDDDANAELQAEVDSLTEQLATREAELQGQIDQLQAQLDAEPEAAAFDPATTPDFARWFGELMSSRTGSSQLSQAQSTCFGTAIIADIGLDAIGRGLYLAATGEDNNNVVGAMQRAADTCGIPQGLIF